MRNETLEVCGIDSKLNILHVLALRQTNQHGRAYRPGPVAQSEHRTPSPGRVGQKPLRGYVATASATSPRVHAIFSTLPSFPMKRGVATRYHRSKAACWQESTGWPTGIR
jgi:hypothetical protein